LLLTIAAFAVLSASNAAAIEPDPLLAAGYKEMYNLEFDSAHHTFQQKMRQDPNDPMGPVSDAAAYLFSEFDRLHILQAEFFVDNGSALRKENSVANPQVKRDFEADLDRTQKLAEAKLKASPDDPNALLASILRLGLNADYLALIQKRYLASLDQVKQSRTLAEHLLSVCPSCYDAYLAVGVENYLLSLKPAPIRWLLRVNGAQTDKDIGIKNLRLTQAKGQYLQPYAQLLLSVAALRDKNPAEAKRLLSDLAGRFPQNQLYREEMNKIQ
jgi:hypothetical protein